MNHLKLSILFEHFRVLLLRILLGKFESNKPKMGKKVSYLKIPGVTMGEKDKKGNATKMLDYKLLRDYLKYPVSETI